MDDVQAASVIQWTQRRPVPQDNLYIFCVGISLEYREKFADEDITNTEDTEVNLEDL